MPYNTCVQHCQELSKLVGENQNAKLETDNFRFGIMWNTPDKNKTEIPAQVSLPKDKTSFRNITNHTFCCESSFTQRGICLC